MLEVLTLQGGIPLNYIFNKSPVGHLVIHFSKGSRSDPDQMPGMCHLIEHMLFKGDKQNPYIEIISRIEGLGGDINAYTTKEYTVLYCSFMNEYMAETLALVAGIVRNPGFDDVELRKEKKVIADEIKSYQDSPAERIFDEFEQLLFKGHPLGNDILGSVSSLKRIDQSAISAFYRQNFAADFYMSIVTDHDKAKTLDIISRFSAMTEIKHSQYQRKEVNYVRRNKTLRDEVHQVHCIMGHCAPDYYSHWRQVYRLMANMLGGPGLSSYLNLLVREKHALTYSIEAGYTPYTDTGIFYVYFTCDEKRLEQTSDLVRGELNRIRHDLLSDTDVQRGILQFQAQLALHFEAPLNEALFSAKNLHIFGQPVLKDDIYKEVRSIQSKDIMECAEELLKPDQMSVITIQNHKS